MLPNKKYTPVDFLGVARKNVALIVVPAVFGLFVALIYSSKIVNVYQGETLIQIVPQRVPDRFVPTTVTIQTEDRIEALGQQVKSRTQLERLIVDLNLYPQERATRPMQDVVEMMRPAVDLETVRPNRMAPIDAFYVRFKYGDPSLAARATERLGNIYIELNARERGNLAEAAKEFLDTQLADVTKRLEQEDLKLQKFREEHAGRLPTQLDSNIQGMQNTQMQRQNVVAGLESDRSRKLMLERLYNDAIVAPLPVGPSTGGPASAAGTSATSPTMPARQRLQIARANLKQLQQRLTPDHPDMRRARREVDELEKMVAGEPAPVESAPTEAAGISPEAAQRRSQVSGLQAELDSLTRQIATKEGEERRLSGIIADYQSKIEAVPGVESQWLSLTRDYDTLKRSFEDLVAKSESANTAVNLENRQVGEQFRVLDPPRVPSRPISPNRMVISGVGLGGGLVLGLLLVALMEVRDGSFKTEKEIETVLALPVIALVPTVVTDADRAAYKTRRAIAASAAFCVVCGAAYLFWSMRLWSFLA